MKVEYSIMLKRNGDPDLFFIKLETPVRNIHDFCTMIQQQIQNGKIPSDADIVCISVSDFIDTE